MFDLVSVGEILIDLTQTGIDQQNTPLFAAYPGGAPANVAVAASRLGARCAFLGKVGKDGLGNSLVRTLTDNGVDTSGVRYGEQATTMAVVTVSPGGERSFRFLRGADQELDTHEIAEPLLAQTKILHFGTVSMTPGPSRSATVFAARQAKAKGAVISFDPNYRAPLWPSAESALQWMYLPLPIVDILKLSDEELCMMTGTKDPELGCQALADQNVPLMLVTLGEQGVFYCWQGQTGQISGIPTQVADTNGAGDSFLGAVLSRLAQRPQGPLTSLTRSELEEILTFANRAAAWTCSRSGAIPAMPYQADLL